ncbi:MAG: restriction endonuclease subunit S [Christensenellales bacterium]
MIPEQLKLSILQSAFQGKLTGECVPNETADDLYQQIQSEKQRLISEKKIKKEKPLPEISADEIPFDIPDNWRWCYVGDLFLHNTGKAQNSSGSTNGIIRKFITTSNLYWGEFDFTKVKEMPFTDTELERCTVKRGDLLVCEGGDCGRSAVWDYDEEVCIQNHVHRLRPYRDVNIYYFYYLFYLYKNTGRLRGRGVAIQGLSNEAIHKVVLPLAPLEEQHRIVAKIEELLPYVDRYATAYEKLEQFNAKFPEDMKKSILQYAIQGKLVEQREEEGTGEELYRQIQAEKKRLIKEGKIKKEKPLPEIAEDEIPFDIPGSWKWVRVAQIVTFNPKNDLADDLETSFIPMPCVMDGFRNQHTFEIKLWKDIKKGYTHFAEGDVGVAKITPCFQNRKSIIFRNLKNGYGAGTTELTVVRTINDTVLPEYLLWLFKTEYFIANGVKSFTGTAGQQRIHKDYLATCLIPLPPLAEQRRIVAKLDEILPLCERLK